MRARRCAAVADAVRARGDARLRRFLRLEETQHDHGYGKRGAVQGAGSGHARGAGRGRFRITNVSSPNATHPVVKIEHVRRIPGRPMSTLAGEWGLSLHLESRARARGGQYLLDFGYTPEILTRNFELLDIDPARLDGLILSHGHRDHYGGLQGFVEQHRRHMRDDLASMPAARRISARNGCPIAAPRSRSRGARSTAPRCAASRVEAVCCDAAQALDGAFTTGHIARQSFERGDRRTRWSSRPRSIISPPPSGVGGSSRTSSRGACDLLHRAGTRARGDLVLRPCRHHQFRQDGDGGRECRTSCTP